LEEYRTALRLKLSKWEGENLLVGDPNKERRDPVCLAACAVSSFPLGGPNGLTAAAEAVSASVTFRQSVLYTSYCLKRDAAAPPTCGPSPTSSPASASASRATTTRWPCG